MVPSWTILCDTTKMPEERIALEEENKRLREELEAMRRLLLMCVSACRARAVAVLPLTSDTMCDI